MDQDNKKVEVSTEERKFIHDLSNQIVVAQGMASFVLRAIKNNPAVEAKEIERLEKSLAAINNMTELLKERRQALHSKLVE